MRTPYRVMLASVVAIMAIPGLAKAQPANHPIADRERLIGAWHLVRIDSSGEKDIAKPRGMLIYTRDGHMSVQLMYPRSSGTSNNEYVQDEYEASFGSYDLDEGTHTITHHVQGSVTRDLLVGKDLSRVYQFTTDGKLIIRSARPDEHWSVIWEHY